MSQLLENYNPSDDCPICHAKNSVELFNNYGKRLNYRQAIEMYMEDKTVPEFKYLSTAICTKCKSVMDIVWNEDNFPLVYPENTNLMIKRFKHKFLKKDN